jgi:hypothetical protein
MKVLQRLTKNITFQQLDMKYLRVERTRIFASISEIPAQEFASGEYKTVLKI